MPNTDIEGLRNESERFLSKAYIQRDNGDLSESLIIDLAEFIQQKVVEAQDRSRAEAYEDIRSTMLYHFAYSGRKTIKYCDIDKIAPSAINPITNEIYPNFRIQP